MSYLSMMEAKLPPGFRFHPRDEELVNDYLAKKLAGDGEVFPMMVDVDLNKCEPWDLPDIACVGGKEWYFFSLRDRKYATGQRTNRATVSGYWKATGKDRQVVDSRRRRGGGGDHLAAVVGMRKTLVFYQGRAPKGKKTDWVMHEFRMEGGDGAPPPTPAAARFPLKEDWVLCRVFFKSRTLSAKPMTSIENCYDDTGSSSLPPLMDTTTFISFEQPPLLLNLEGYNINEQVPCFSNLPLGQQQRQNPSPSPVEAADAVINNRRSSAQFGGGGGGLLPDLGPYLTPFSCDKKAIKTFLDHLTKLEGNNNMKEEAALPNLAEGSSESYLTAEVTHGVPSMWNPF